MAAAARRESQLPSHQRAEPGSCHLVAANLPTSAVDKSDNALEIATEWIGSFNQAIANQNYAVIFNLFMEDSYWRDHLCLTWDFHTFKSSKRIAEFLKDAPKGCRIKAVSLDESTALRSPVAVGFDLDGNTGVQTFLQVENDIGTGVGLLRLVKQGTSWKALILYTCLRELRGYEEKRGKLRPLGLEHVGQPKLQNWHERRAAHEKYEATQPAVIIVGAGQAGLATAARLKMLGVDSLIIDHEVRVGDNWRLRYHQLVLHDPGQCVTACKHPYDSENSVWFDHLPYVEFPSTWPIFTPKDKLADWFEGYVRTLELNVWTQSKIVGSEWDDDTRQWTVRVERTQGGKSEIRILHPRHIVLATGHAGEPDFPSHIEGINDFKGDRLVHSSKYTCVAPNNGAGRKAVVIGSCNSGHDIAQDYYDNGYDVTIVQRSSTLVVAGTTIVQMLLGSLYYEGGPPVDDADILNLGIPSEVVKRIHTQITVKTNEKDKSMLAGLDRAGFKIDQGPDDAGLWIKYLQRGGGYYIDVGTSQLIIDGKIKIKQGHEVIRIQAHSLVFDDGSELEADEVVFATGFQRMRSSVRKILGDEVADRVCDVWGFDEQGEIRGMWRKSGHAGFWFAGGNLALCRYYSRSLALAIKGLEEGLYKYGEP